SVSIATSRTHIRSSHVTSLTTAPPWFLTSEHRQALIPQDSQRFIKPAISTLAFRIAGISERKFSTNCDSVSIARPRLLPLLIRIRVFQFLWCMVDRSEPSTLQV